MSTGIIGLNLIIAAGGLVICVMCFVQVFTETRIDKQTRKFLVAIFAILVAYMFFDLAAQFSDDYAGPVAVTANRLFILLESITPTFAMLELFAFMLYTCGEKNWYQSAAFRIAVFLWLIYLAMLVFNEFSGVFYAVDKDNIYQRGPYYPAILVPPALIMVLGLIVLYRRRKMLSTRKLFAFSLYMLIPAIFMVCQMLFYGIYATVLGTAIGAMAMYINIERDKVEQLYAYEAENTRLKADIMLSQLQPHFLCNTLGAIGALCKNDIEAKQAINAFSRYLRENVDAVSQETPVSFERELEHTRTYIMLEQLRFGDDLKVSYDIKYTDFELPTLTLQPLVENAVRHGIRGTEEGTGTVSISSREYDNHWEIMVADDGAGFDPEEPMKDDGRIHVGLPNVQKRLSLVSSGSLHIESERGRGTVITVSIPKKGYKLENLRNR